MSTLIDQDRALCNLSGQTLSADELDTLDALIAAVSQAIENHCRRTFAVTAYDERHDGMDDDVLLLRHYPVTALERVAADPAAVLRIENTSPSVQRASVRVSSSGVTLTHVVSGVATETTIPFASAVTLGDLADDIVVLGNGWSATVLEDPERASADLAGCPGTWAARAAPAELRVHVRDVTDYELEPRIGVLTRPLGWPGGASAYRVVYSAGYATIPDDVQEACAQIVAQLFWQTRRDPGLAQETILAAVSRRPTDDWPASARMLISPYRRIPRG